MSALVALGRHGLDTAVAETPKALARARSFHTLDALRGVAALTVVLVHTAFFFETSVPAEGQIAVDLFFVMSGFIIAYRYDGDLEAGMGVKRFVVTRLVRLYPLYLLGAVLGVLPAIVAVAGGHADGFHEGLVEAFPFHLLMLPSRFAVPRIEEIFPLNYVAWSLALEMLINIAYAATFRLWTIRSLVMLVAGAFLALCACVAFYGTTSIGYAWANAPGGAVRILYGFPMGVLLYRLFARRPFTVRVSWWSLLLVAIAIFFVPVPWGKPIWELVAVTAFVPLIVAAAVANEPPRAAQRVCALAGVFSYVLYSLHAPFIGLFLRGEDQLHLDIDRSSPGKAICFALSLAVLCLIGHYAYDKPVRRWLAPGKTEDGEKLRLPR